MKKFEITFKTVVEVVLDDDAIHDDLDLQIDAVTLFDRIKDKEKVIGHELIYNQIDSVIKK